MWIIFCIFMGTWRATITSPVPISINGHLMTTGDLNPQEHQIFFRQMGEYVMDMKFHHLHIPIFLHKINKVTDRAIEKVKTYAKNVFEESMMHYHEDNQYAHNKKS
jgi:hypothetical protein